MVDVKFKHTLGGLKIPKFDKDGMVNLYATEDYLVKPSETVKVKVGMIFEVPQGYILVVLPPSKVSEKTTLRFANSLRVVTSEDREEVDLLIENVTPVSAKKMLIPGFYYLDGRYSGNDYSRGYLPIGTVLIQKGDLVGRAYLQKIENASMSRVAKKKETVEENENETT